MFVTFPPLGNLLKKTRYVDNSYITCIKHTTFTTTMATNGYFFFNIIISNIIFNYIWICLKQCQSCDSLLTMFHCFIVNCNWCGQWLIFRPTAIANWRWSDQFDWHIIWSRKYEHKLFVILIKFVTSQQNGVIGQTSVQWPVFTD